jgi:hypothetical protein
MYNMYIYYHAIRDEPLGAIAKSEWRKAKSEKRLSADCPVFHLTWSCDRYHFILGSAW